MKYRSITFLLLAMLLVPTFTACSPRTLNDRLDTAEEIAEERMDVVGDMIEDHIDNTRNNVDNRTDNAEPSVENNGDTAAIPPSVTPTTPSTAITKEKAESIALSHAGFTSEEVSHLYTELDFDDGIYKYEVQFYHGSLEYDYDIHAETGTIISFDKDY